MNSKALSVFFLALLPAGLAIAQQSTVKLNGGLEAEIVSLGRSDDHQYLTISMRIANKGRDTAYLLLIGKEAAIDNKGTVFNWRYSLSGIADCGINNSQPSGCAGIPRPNNDTMSPQGYTEIDPDREIVVNFRLRGDGGAAGNGSTVSFSATLAARFVSDPAKDAALSDAEKLKQVRLMTLSFPPRAVPDK